MKYTTIRSTIINDARARSKDGRREMDGTEEDEDEGEEEDK